MDDQLHCSMFRTQADDTVARCDVRFPMRWIPLGVDRTDSAKSRRRLTMILDEHTEVKMLATAQ